MKTLAWFILGVAGIGMAGWWTLNSQPEPPAPESTANTAALHKGTMTSDMPPEEVFKRALWKRPTADDTIRHALRREWTVEPTQGPAHWHWFLAVDASPTLWKWLREENLFSLYSTSSVPSACLAEAPAWFPKESEESGKFDVFTGGAVGSLTFLFSRQDRTFFAAGHGAGFAPSGSPVTPRPDLAK